MNENETRSSLAKSLVAQQKPRDSKGRFLSGEELQAYRIEEQARMQQMEREKVARMLGQTRGGVMPEQGLGMQTSQAIPSNFAAILAANRPGAQSSDNDKLATLLGKKKRLI